MFRILLIQPPVEDFFFTPARSYPLGLLSLATVLEQAGFQVRILNCPALPGRQTVPLPPELHFLRRYYHPNLSPFRLFSAYYSFGADSESIEREIRSFAPDIVGIALNFTPYVDAGFRVAELVKRIAPGITVVAGGRAATAQPALVMRNAAFDYLIRGEAELSLRDLCVALRRGVSLRGIVGLCSRRTDGSVRISRSVALIKDLDELPLVNRTLIDFSLHQFQGRPLASLLASRGCALGCSFCAIRERYRFRSVYSVLQEMEQGYALGIRHFNFEDDTINLHPQFERLLDVITARFRSDIRISFMNGLLSRGLTTRMAAKLAGAGLTHADFSVGSMVPRLRKDMKRREDARQIFPAAQRLQKHNIFSTMHFIIGYPGQTFEDAVCDIREMARQPLLLGPSIFYPVPGSAVFSRIRKHYQSPTSYRLMRSSAASYARDIPRDRLMTLFYLSRVVNVIKGVIDAEDVGHVDDVSGANHAPAVKTRDKLTRVLLRKLFDEQEICRAVRKGKDSVEFIKEEFVRPEDVRMVLGGLEVCGVRGKKFRIPMICAT